MNYWKKKSAILITCPKGVAPYLQNEVTALGFPMPTQFDTAVRTAGTLEDTLLLNLHLRTASRILYLLENFTADSPGALYGNLSNFPWETLISATGKDAYLCVTSTVDNPLITDSRFVNVKAKDAIVDRIREKCGGRPDSGPEKDRAVVHIYWKDNKAAVYLDTSGERLAMRGYRKIPLAAPMQETLAAAIILASGWNGRGAFVNPMCGSGTLAIEAAMIAANRAPGLSRSNFGFMHIQGFPETLWQEMRKKARNEVKKQLPVKMIATDIDPEAVYAAKRNAQTAGVDHFIEFDTCSFEKTVLPQGGGLIIVNPPYGERMNPVTNKNQSYSREEFSKGRKIIIRKPTGKPERKSIPGVYKQLETLYEGLGDFFKKAGGNYRGYIFTGNLEMIKKIGLRTKRRMIMYNGDIECRLLEYELYQGSRKNPEA